MDYTTPEAVRKTGIIDPEMEELLKTLPPPDESKSLTNNYPEWRQAVADLEDNMYNSFPSHGTHESVMTIPMRDGYQSELRITKPTTSSGQTPLVVLMYGGAFVAGSNRQLIPMARIYAALYDVTVVNLSYRLAPEYKFPTAPNDNAGSIGADLSRGFVLGGISAGANLTAVTAQRALKEKLSPPLTGLLVSIPVAVTEESVPKKYRELFISREQNAQVPGLSGKDIKTYEALYEPDHRSENYSPLNSDIKFTRLPRTYVQVCGLDPLRDDGLIYEKVLRDDGVQTKLDLYPGMPHGNWMLFPGLKQSVKARIDSMAGVGWLLGKEKEREEIARFCS